MEDQGLFALISAAVIALIKIVAYVKNRKKEEGTGGDDA